MRSFGEVIVHIASGVLCASGRGDQARWDELNAKDYLNKAAAVARLGKSVADANATLISLQTAAFSKTVEPWVAVLGYSAEDYGLVVAYYRANGLVRPESRQRVRESNAFP